MAAGTVVMASQAHDSDTDSEDAGLTEVEDLLARRTLLRLRLRLWERAFEAHHGHRAQYADKKLARDYQQLQARLRMVEIRLTIKRGKLPEPEDLLPTEELESCRSDPLWAEIWFS